MLNRENPEELALIEKMHEFNLRPNHRISWCAVIRDEKTDKTKFLDYTNRPCYGEMRRYRDGTRPKDPHPSDLPRPIPKGIREAVGVYFGRLSARKENHNALIDYAVSERSPWRRGLDMKGVEFTYDKDGFICGMVMTETEVDPTPMVALFMFLRSQRNQYGGTFADRFAEFREKYGVSEAVALLMCQYTYWNGSAKRTILAFNGGYYLSHKLSAIRFFTGRGHDLSNGRTWRDQEDYNRPEIQDYFMDTSEAAKPLINVIGAATGVTATMNTWDQSASGIDDKLATIAEYLTEQERSAA